MQWRGGMVCLKGLLVLLSLLSANSLRVPFHSNGQREGGPLFLEASGAERSGHGKERQRQARTGREVRDSNERGRQAGGRRQAGRTSRESEWFSFLLCQSHGAQR